MEGKERALPLNESQRVVLLNMIKERDGVINNKSTAPGITEQKKSAWEDISKNFNSQYPDQEPRSSKQLKRSYDHVKRKVKEEDRILKKKIKTTGGGPPPTPPKAKEEISLAASMMEVDLAMGNDIYETFSLMPADDRSSPEIYVLQKENDPGVAGQTAASWNLHPSSTPIHSNRPSLSPNHVPASSSSNSTTIPPTFTPPLSSSPAVISTPLQPPLQTITTSAEASSKPKQLRAHHQRTKVRNSAKDDAYMCRSRQEEFHRLKIAQMRENHDLEVKQYKLDLEQKNEIHALTKKKLNLEIEEIQKRGSILENIQNKVDDIHSNLIQVLDSAKRAYDAMGPEDD